MRVTVARSGIRRSVCFFTLMVVSQVVGAPAAAAPAPEDSAHWRVSFLGLVENPGASTNRPLGLRALRAVRGGRCGAWLVSSPGFLGVRTRRLSPAEADRLASNHRSDYRRGHSEPSPSGKPTEGPKAPGGGDGCEAGDARPLDRDPGT